jgi:hypothetical protein
VVIAIGSALISKGANNLAVSDFALRCARRTLAIGRKSAPAGGGSGKLNFRVTGERNRVELPAQLPPECAAD